MIIIINYMKGEENMRKLSIFIISIFLLIVLAACGTSAEETEEDVQDTNDTASESSDKESNLPIEVTDASGETITFESIPESAATLSSGDLDILHNLGVEIVGRPTTNVEVPADVEDAPEIGNLHQPNFEKIAEANPEVLIAPLSFERHAANIEEQGTKVVYSNANSIADIQETIEVFGQIFHKEAEAEKINNGITEKTEGIEADEEDPVRALLVYGTTESSLAALPNSLSGDLLEKAGGENIAQDFELAENFPNYANLSPERIIERNPEVIMLITHGEPETVKEAFEQEMETNAAWFNLDAVKNGNVVILPSDLFGANPGTKIVDALEVMSESLESVR